jgi:hypothetical protein
VARAVTLDSWFDFFSEFKNFDSVLKMDLLPSNVLAAVLYHTIVHDVASGLRFESTCRSVLRASANYLVWRDVAALHDLVELETAQMLPYVGYLELEGAGVGHLPEFSDSDFEASTEPLPAVLAASLELAPPAASEGLVAVYSLSGCGQTSARRNATLREICLRMRRAGGRLDGFWMGEYGSHGTEIVYLEQRGWRATARKLVGDPNVPSGEITVDVLLDWTLQRAVGRLRLADHGFRHARWGLLFADECLSRRSGGDGDELRFCWFAGDLVLRRVSAAEAAQVINEALPHESWLDGTHRLPLARMPAEAREAFRRAGISLVE